MKEVKLDISYDDSIDQIIIIMSTDNSSQTPQNDPRPSQPPQAQAQPQPQSAPPATPDLNMGTPIWLTESFDPANLTTKNQNS